MKIKLLSPLQLNLQKGKRVQVSCEENILEAFNTMFIHVFANSKSIILTSLAHIFQSSWIKNALTFVLYTKYKRHELLYRSAKSHKINCILLALQQLIYKKIHFHKTSFLLRCTKRETVWTQRHTMKMEMEEATTSLAVIYVIVLVWNTPRHSKIFTQKYI